MNGGSWSTVQDFHSLSGLESEFDASAFDAWYSADPSAVFERLKLSESSESFERNTQWLRDQTSRAINGIMTSEAHSTATLHCSRTTAAIATHTYYTYTSGSSSFAASASAAHDDISIGEHGSHRIADPSASNSSMAPPPNPLAVGVHTGSMGGLPFTPSNMLPGRPSLPDDPVIPHNGFATLEEGEKAFTQLLRRAGIDTSWKWDQTIRATITDPLYKALNTFSEKKNCWQKEKEREEREARLAKIRPAIRNMLKGNPNVFHYSTFQSADRLFAQHPIWQQAKIESERKMIFEEYVAELKQREVQESRAVRACSVGKVVVLFKELNVDVLTRWCTTYSALRDSDAWATDPELQRLPSLDVLLAFEDYARVQEREFEDRMRRETLVDVGRIRAKSKWKDVYPDFGDDEQYLGLLGIPGSNPLELFWDVVDSFDQKLDAKVTVVEEAIRKFDPNTTEEEFFAAVAAAQMHHEDSQSLDKDDLNEIYDFMHSDLVKRLESERRRAQRKQRHMQDDFRYALKKLSDPIDVNASYDDAIPLMENLPEYKTLEDEGRRAAFGKFIKRQKERLRERELSEDGGSGTVNFGGPGGSAGFAGGVTPGLPTPLPSAAAGGGGGDVAMWGVSVSFGQGERKETSGLMSA
ncbi:hypothetical protein DFH11DRAFT_1733497 [Phellopilus nigrolimitatus]|nr:hypothetical protein DFH11DRAFT_1733497 [Phellopilus nigrolimitatus]